MACMQPVGGRERQRAGRLSQLLTPIRSHTRPALTRALFSSSFLPLGWGAEEDWGPRMKIPVRKRRRCVVCIGRGNMMFGEEAESNELKS